MILYSNPSHYVIDAGKKGYEVYRHEGTAAVRAASIGRSLGLDRAISEANKRHDAQSVRSAVVKAVEEEKEKSNG
jgi:hypothetical protein